MYGILFAGIYDTNPPNLIPKVIMFVNVDPTSQVYHKNTTAEYNAEGTHVTKELDWEANTAGNSHGHY